MKKLISVLICISMLLSVVPMVSQAVEVSSPVFVDFEDYVAGVSNSYKDGYIVFPSTSYETPAIDDEHGKSIKLYSPATGSTEYVNAAFELTENAVFGFSYYSDDSTPSFVVSSKVTNTHKNEKGWIDVNSIATINGSEIKVGSAVLSDISYTKGTWINFAFAMDYINHKVDVYINGQYAGSHIPKTGSENFLATDRFNLSIVAGKYSDIDNTKAAALCFDNMFVYYPHQTVTAKVTGDPGDSGEKDEIIVDFGQNVILPSVSSYVSLNGDTTVEAEPVVKHGYVTGIKIKNLSLSGGTDYTVAFPGVTDFLGNDISELVFTTDSIEPKISITCKNPDAVYEVGDSAEFEIESAYLGGNNIVIYRNGEVYDTLGADATEFRVELVGGNNEIYAVVPGLSLETEKVDVFVDNTPYLSISKQGTNTSHSAGDSVKFSISSANLDGTQVEIYHNGSLAYTISSNESEFTVVLTGGNNTVFAKVPELDIKTETITLMAQELGPVGEVKCLDFETGTTEGIYSYGEKEGSIQITETDEVHGKSLCFSIDGTKVDASVADNKPYIIADSVKDKKGTYVFEADLKFSQVEESGNIFPLKCRKSGSDVWNTLYVLEDGNIKLKTGTKETVYSGVLPDVWYNLKATWNSETNTSEFYVNGVKVASDVPFSSKNIDSFVYVNMSIISKTGEQSSMYMDNIKSYFIAKMANAEFVFQGSDSSEVSYENTVITLGFDQVMNGDTLKNIKLTSATGKFVFVDFESYDDLTFAANVSGLNPNTFYTIDLSDVIAQSGVGVNPSKLSFKTRKAPVAIRKATVLQSGDKLNVSTDIQNLNSQQKSYVIVATLYSNNMMLSYSVESFTSNKAETAGFTFDKPESEYSVEIYMFDSLEELNVLDCFIIN